MANDRDRTEEFTGPTGGSDSEAGEDTVGSGMGEDVRGVADEGDDEEFDDADELEDDDEKDGSF